MCYSSRLKDLLVLKYENQPFFKRMENLIFGTHRPLSSIILFSSLSSAMLVKAAYLYRKKLVT